MMMARYSSTGIALTLNKCENEAIIDAARQSYKYFNLGRMEYREEMNELIDQCLPILCMYVRWQTDVERTHEKASEIKL